MSRDDYEAIAKIIEDVVGKDTITAVKLLEGVKFYLDNKIDTVKKVVENRKFRNFYLAYFTDIDFSYTDEVRKLNKLIAEKPQQQYFKEGYYLYPGSRKVIPQSHLNNILYPKK